MKNRDIMKQMVEFHKQSLENCFSMMVMLQLQAENIFNFFHYLPLTNEESKKLMEQRTDAYKKWIDDLKKILDDGYARLEQFCNSETVMKLNDHTDKMYHYYLNQAPWMPDDWKKTMGNLEGFYKKGCDEFKKYVDDYIHGLKNYYSAAQTEKTKDKQH